ncbi:pentapeptide repeat-containing protein [Lishizhenia sp.]|uniref:pentapeptide repeat-containing protein n=1 Tax=Lishizhenia sp. TaxID=2497594 RepID=UPI00299D6A98|nr:pentapeptide repeat-containing protein [Lishizhenia sp.]MDX1445269.1 pentapeptide repeat-containing protein [Lishizhenia sp.]
MLAEDEYFETIDFRKDGLTFKTYDNCTFKQCNFSEVNLSNVDFLDCEFMDCEMSNAIIGNTAFKNVRFNNCKMLGLQFEYANPFLLQLAFKGCKLDFSNFQELNLPSCNFLDSSLQGVEFTGAKLEKANFSGSNLDGAVFVNTTLNKADFSRAYNFTIHPERNKLNHAIFAQEGLSGLVAHLKIKIK